MDQIARHGFLSQRRLVGQSSCRLHRFSLRNCTHNRLRMLCLVTIKPSTNTEPEQACFLKHVLAVGHISPASPSIYKYTTIIPWLLIFKVMQDFYQQQFSCISQAWDSQSPLDKDSSPSIRPSRFHMSLFGLWAWRVSFRVCFCCGCFDPLGLGCKTSVHGSNSKPRGQTPCFVKLGAASKFIHHCRKLLTASDRKKHIKRPDGLAFSWCII